MLLEKIAWLQGGEWVGGGSLQALGLEAGLDIPEKQWRLGGGGALAADEGSRESRESVHWGQESTMRGHPSSPKQPSEACRRGLSGIHKEPVGVWV